MISKKLKYRWLKIFNFLFVVTSMLQLASAQENGIDIKKMVLTIDLSKIKPGTYTQTIEPFTVANVTLKNILASANYLIETKRAIIPVPPLQYSRPTASPTNCNELQTTYNKLKDLPVSDDIYKEDSVGILIDTLNAVLKRSANCTDNSLKTKVNEILIHSNYNYNLLQSLQIKKGQSLTVTVTRGNQKWIFNLETEVFDHWKTFYGFSYVSNWLNPNQTYYSNQLSDTTYAITKNNDYRKDYLKNITPTILFTWRPESEYSFLGKGTGARGLYANEFYKLGFSAGFGSDLEDFSVLASPSIIIGDNISINPGFIFTSKDILKGKYTEGQILHENIDFDGLHEKKWQLEYVISIAFHFESNPLNKPTETTK